MLNFWYIFEIFFSKLLFYCQNEIRYEPIWRSEFDQSTIYLHYQVPVIFK